MWILFRIDLPTAARQYQHAVGLRTVPVGTRVYAAYFSSLSGGVGEDDSLKLRPQTIFRSPKCSKVMNTTYFQQILPNFGLVTGFINQNCPIKIRISRYFFAKFMLTPLMHTLRILNFGIRRV